MLLGDFCAIGSSAVFAFFTLSSNSIMKTNSVPHSVYFGMMCVFNVLISCLLSWYMGNPVDLFSADPVTGVFGMMANMYYKSSLIPLRLGRPSSTACADWD